MMASVNVSNWTKEAAEAIEVSMPETPVTVSEWLLVVAFIIIMCTGTMGNLLVCYVFGIKKRRRRTTTEWLILYLGIIDLFSSLFNPPLYIYWTVTHFRSWHFGYYGCKIIPAIGPIMTSASTGILLIFAIDRYLAIVTPFYGQLSWRCITIANIVNLNLSVLAYAHYIFALTLSPNGKFCYVPDVQTLEYGVPNCTLIIFRLSAFLVVFGFTNVKIFFTLLRNESSSTVKELKKQRHVQSMKVMLVLLTMGIVFTVLVFPRELFYLAYNLSWLNSDNGIKFNNNLLVINSWLKVMHTANSCANVFIYAHMQTLYRKHVIKFLHFLGCCKNIVIDNKLHYSQTAATRSRLGSLTAHNINHTIPNAPPFLEESSPPPYSPNEQCYSPSYSTTGLLTPQRKCERMFSAHGYHQLKSERVFFMRAQQWKNKNNVNEDIDGSTIYL